MSHPPTGPNMRRVRRLQRIVRRNHERIDALKPVIREDARRLGLWDGVEFLRDNLRDFECLADYRRYAGTSRRQNLVERHFAQRQPPRDHEARLVRDAMLRARYSVYRIDRTARPVHYLTDMLTGESLKFVDDQYVVRNTPLIAGRLMDLGDFSIAAGPVYEVFPAIWCRAKAKFRLRTRSSLPRHMRLELNIFLARSCIRSGAVAAADYMGSVESVSFAR